MNGKIKKRSGEIVDFAPEKIGLALRKAFMAVRGGIDEVALKQLTDDVILEIEKKFIDRLFSVEDVQNTVERILMQHTHFDVAKSYIIYRYEHALEREEKKRDILEKIERNDLVVVKRSGKTEKFSSSKLKKSLTWAVIGLEQTVDLDLIVQHAESGLFDGIKTEGISKALVMAARSLIERDPAYSKVAVRLLFDLVYKEVIGADQVDFKNFEEQYRQAFITGIRKGVEIGRLDPRLLSFDLEALSRRLDISRDDLFMYLGGQTLYDRYFISNPESKRVIELPQAFWMRVAMGVAIAEEHKIDMATKFYDSMSTFRFVPSTPTLFHAGTPHPQLSSCYLTTVNDSLDHIFKCIADNAQLSKWSGGIANDWTNLRATGALIRGTGVESQGVIPFLKVANDTTVAINRSGRRRGATCAYLETWHVDIEDFLELRKNTGDERRRTHDMNTASWIPDLFFKRLNKDEHWTLFSPDETPDLHHLYGKNFEKRYAYYERLASEGRIKLFKVIKAKELWKKMLMMLFETGHPWITFKDPSNLRSPQDHVGVVHSSNLCTEITLNTSEDETAVCNLGSVNLAKHIINGRFSIESIQETVTIAMRMLDNVIDINFYPTSEAKNSNLKHRPVGLGVMGFQDALYLQGLRFDSDECVRFADESMEAVSYYAILTSSQLAEERGTYKTYKGSKWDRGIFPVDTLNYLEEDRGEAIPVPRTATLDWSVVRDAVKRNGMRNSNCLAVAPTATISNIAGCCPTIEPIYKNVYVKSNMSGEFTVVNNYLVEDLKRLGLWNQTMLEEIKGHDGSLAEILLIPQEIKETYKEVFDIDPQWLIKAAAYRGKWIDQSQSLNLYIKGTSGKKISDMYLYAWSMGLKTTYYLRSLGASAVEKSTLDLGKQQVPATSQAETAPAAVAEPIAVVPEPVAVQPTLEATASVGLAAMAEPEVRPKLMLCKIDDPLCEACQ